MEKGAIVLLGGGRAQGFSTGVYYQPTVVVDVTPGMLFNRDKTFGPVAPVTRGSSDDKILALANSTIYGCRRRSPPRILAESSNSGFRCRLVKCLLTSPHPTGSPRNHSVVSVVRRAV